MKSLESLLGVVCLGLACSVVYAQSGTVSVSASHLANSSAQPITDASVCFAPVNATGQPISYHIDGAGQATSSPVCTQVSDGTFSIVVADTSMTTPQNICFSVTVTDNVSGQQLFGAGYSCVQPAYNTTVPNNWCTNGACNFDNYAPGGPSLPLSGSYFQGGTMTGPLYLFEDPIQPKEAATKEYVDNAIAAASASVGGSQQPLAAPVFSPATGSYNAAQSVTISGPSGASILYCQDTNNSCSPGTAYVSAISISSSGYLRAVAVESGYASSPTASAQYTISTPQASAPTFTPASPYSGGATSVIISDATEGASILYCTDTANSCTPGTPYTTPLSFSSTEYIRATATAAGYSSSATASWQGTLASGNYPTYSDNLQRANGALGSDWTVPQNANPLTISNDTVVAATAPELHALEYYSAGIFANNQWSSDTIVNRGNSNSATAVMVRADGNTPSEFYNDGPQGTADRIGIATPLDQPTDFCESGMYTPFAAGDTDELAVAGSGPVFFWILRDGVINGTCLDTTYNYTGGYPGLGVAGDYDSTPTTAVSNWQGGSLPNFSTTPTDNFQRANAGWLGVNWWFPQSDGQIGTAFVLSNDSAAVLSSGIAMAVWTTPLSVNQSSAVTIGSTTGDTWIAAVARYTPVANARPGGIPSNQFYMALVEPNGLVDLFEYSSATWNQLGSSLGTYSGAVNTIELDATGTSPVTLTVKINGSQFGSAYTDSIYRLTGAYAGFIVDGTPATTVTGWTGANL